MKFSLIVPTLGRVIEIEKLLFSIQNLKHRDFEVIIIDQNENNLIDNIVEGFINSIDIKHYKVDFKGAARARNYGVSVSNGDILNFPDDDCELTANILDQVNEKFDKNQDLDLLFGRSIDKEKGNSSVVNFQNESAFVTMKNIYTTTVEFTMFIKRNVFEAIGGFDPELGVGTFFGAEEGADLVLRALYLQKKVFYNPELVFYHPQKVLNYNEKEFSRAFNYGKGFGRLSYKHYYKYKENYALYRFLIFQIRATGGFLLNSLKFKRNKARYYLNVIKGRQIGFSLTRGLYRKNHDKEINNIFINGRFLTQKLTGVQRVAVELTRKLDDYPDLNVTILAPKNHNLENINFKNIDVKTVGTFKGHLWEQIELWRYCKKGVLLNFCNTGPLFVKNQIVFLHDAAVFSYPKAYSTSFRIWYKLMFNNISKNAKRIFTVSQFSKQELMKYLKINEEKISVINLGKDHFDEIKDQDDIFIKYKINKPYLLAVSSQHPNKNFEVILKALKLLDMKTYEFVIAGGTNPKIFKDDDTSKSNFVKYLGYVSDEDLKGLYKNAYGFVFPSIYEGFGLPPIEAMSCGCPVIASNYASIPEVCGNAAIYFDPRDPEDLAKKISLFLSDKMLQDEMKTKGKSHASEFSWDKAIKVLLKEIY